MSALCQLCVSRVTVTPLTQCLQPRAAARRLSSLPTAGVRFVRRTGAGQDAGGFPRCSPRGSGRPDRTFLDRLDPTCRFPNPSVGSIFFKSRWSRSAGQESVFILATPAGKSPICLRVGVFVSMFFIAWPYSVRSPSVPDQNLTCMRRHRYSCTTITSRASLSSHHRYRRAGDAPRMPPITAPHLAHLRRRRGVGRRSAVIGQSFNGPRPRARRPAVHYGSNGQISSG